MIDTIVSIIINSFTPAEWRAFIWLILATLVITHFIKIAWRLLPIIGGGNHNAIHLLAGVVGLLVSIPLWPTGQVPFWIAGPVIGGGGAIGLFKIWYPLLGLICPKCASIFNADRRKVEIGLPPHGIPERRKT